MDTRPVSIFELWRNPILVRYLRARLRWKGMVLTAVPTMILVTFVSLISYFAGFNGHQARASFEERMRYYEENVHVEREPAHAVMREFHQRIRKLEVAAEPESRVAGARTAFLAVFVIQALITMFWGTFSVAVGITREGIEGILEYQRLTPMSPLAKIVGYVIGLPIRETVLCLMTIPFTLVAIRFGEIPWSLIWKLYLIMATSALMYHMTGFLAGIVVKNRFMSGLLSQLLMIVLYLLLPQLSRLGYVIFLYLTVRPVFVETMDALFERFGKEPILDGRHEPFFQTEIPLVWFTLLVQGFLFSVFLLVVYRRIRNQEEHLLGKCSAIPVFGGFVTILLGTILPGIPNESIFPTMSASQFLGGTFREFRPDRPMIWEMMAIPGIFGAAMILVLMLVIFLVTPTADERIKGLRLARKRGRRSVRLLSDSATSLPTTLACVAIAVGAWMIFLTALLESEHYAGWSFVARSQILFPLSILVPVLYVQLILQGGGKAAWFFALLFTWVVPPMAGLVLGLATQEANDLVIYLVSLSGFSLPINAMRIGFEGVENTPAMGAFRFSLVLHGVIVGILFLWASLEHRKMRKRTMEN